MSPLDQKAELGFRFKTRDWLFQTLEWAFQKLSQAFEDLTENWKLESLTESLESLPVCLCYNIVHAVPISDKETVTGRCSGKICSRILDKIPA